jgi:hypothetical protein
MVLNSGTVLLQRAERAPHQPGGDLGLAWPDERQGGPCKVGGEAGHAGGQH